MFHEDVYFSSFLCFYSFFQDSKPPRRALSHVTNALLWTGWFINSNSPVWVQIGASSKIIVCPLLIYLHIGSSTRWNYLCRFRCFSAVAFLIAGAFIFLIGPFMLGHVATARNATNCACHLWWPPSGNAKNTQLPAVRFAAVNVTLWCESAADSRLCACVCHSGKAPAIIHFLSYAKQAAWRNLSESCSFVRARASLSSLPITA